MAPDAVDWTGVPALAPSGALYLTGEDFLRLNVLNGASGVTVTLAGRFLPAPLPGEAWRPHPRPFAHTLIPATDRSVSTRMASLGDGWLLSCGVFASAGTPRRGQCFAIVDVVRGDNVNATPLCTLLQGYVADTTRRAWPGTLLESSVLGPGVLRTILGTGPGAGLEMTETVPNNARWRLLSIFATLVTDVNVASRDAALTFDDGINTLARFPAAQNVAASLTTRYVWTSGGARTVIASDRTIVTPIPDVWLADAFRLKTVTTGIQVGDAWSAPRMFVEEVIED